MCHNIRMGHCTLCGDEQEFPFECSYCGLTFCSKHRLPENHLCSGLREKQHEASKPPSNNAEPESIPIYSSLPGSPAPQKKNSLRNIWIIVAALVLVAVLTASIIMVSQPTNSSNTYQTGYQNGYNVGWQDGRETGYRNGCSEGSTAGWDEGNQSGYEAGYVAGLADRTGYYIRDPSYSEMEAFIASDKTNENEYDVDTYNCYDFTNAVCNNAFERGYRCGFVYVELSGIYAHAIVCFNTTDKGLIFIEPQNDVQVTLTIGKPYNPYPSASPYPLATPDYFSGLSGLIHLFEDEDIVEDYNIIW